MRSTKSRSYRMRRRAAQVDETRQRITEAAVRLHTTVGPAHTSIASVAEEAGVTRLTVYRHFADLDSLFVACTAHWMALNPPPDPEAWRAIPGPETRARLAFTDLYGWYRDHADDLYPIYRDFSSMPPSAQRERAAVNRRLADVIVGVDGSGAADPDADGRLARAVARHLVHFWTWRSLVAEQGLDDREAVDLAVRLITAAAQDGPARDHSALRRST